MLIVVEGIYKNTGLDEDGMVWGENLKVCETPVPAEHRLINAGLGGLMSLSLPAGRCKFRARRACEATCNSMTHVPYSYRTVS